MDIRAASAGRTRIEVLDYVRRFKKKNGNEKHMRLHLAGDDHTLCGIELDEMFFVESSAGFEREDVTCRACMKLMPHVDKKRSKKILTIK
jgi:hypothetical protein